MTDKPDYHREGTDEALMVRYQRGDRNAFAVIVRRYARVVYSTAHAVVGDSDVAAALTQDAFLASVGQAGSFHIEMHFRSWLFGFLHKLLMENRATTFGTVESAAGIAGAGGEQSDAEPLPSATAKASRSQLLSRRIAECAAGLPLLEREALVMKLTAQLSITELAVATASDGDTVRARLRSALERLRDAVSDTEEYARALR